MTTTAQTSSKVGGWFFCKVRVADVAAGLWLTETAARRLEDGSFEIYNNRKRSIISEAKATAHLQAKRTAGNQLVRLNAHEVQDLEAGRDFSSN